MVHHTVCQRLLSFLFVFITELTISGNGSKFSSWKAVVIIVLLVFFMFLAVIFGFVWLSVLID